MNKPNLLHLTLATYEDVLKCKKAAKLNKFPSTAHWFRAIIDGHFAMMGWKPLGTVWGGRNKHKVCKRGHLLTGRNIVIRVRRDITVRLCRECLNLSARNAYRRKRDEQRGILKAS